MVALTSARISSPRSSGARAAAAAVPRAGAEPQGGGVSLKTLGTPIPC